MKKAKEAAGKKRRAKEQKRYDEKRQKSRSSGSDLQLFRGHAMRLLFFWGGILCDFTCYSARVSILILL